MWNHDRYFRNLVGQNVFAEEQSDKLFEKFNDYFYNLQKEFLRSISKSYKKNFGKIEVKQDKKIQNYIRFLEDKKLKGEYVSFEIFNIEILKDFEDSLTS